ncbi:MAG: GWxTD domain-containing protein [Calditrichaeota bacterium]|nr:GWxTD domain-containing protein [Calditrichota bacterium]
MLRLFKLTTFIVLFVVQIGTAAVLELDVCRFKSEGGLIYLELYVEFQRVAIQHKVVEDGRLFGSVRFQVDILEDNILLTTDNWRLEDNADKPDDIDSLQKIVDIRTYKLPPGNYDLRVTATDSISQHSHITTKYVEVPSMPNDALLISDIELANYILQPGLIEKYDRGNFALIPNASLLFGKERPCFFYYFEVYPPDSYSDEVEYTVSYAIILSNGNIIKPMPDMVYVRGATPFADVDSVSLANLSSGTYTFHAKVVTSSGDTVRQSKRFFIYKPDTELVSDQSIGFSQLAPEDSISIESELKEIKFLLTKGQLGRIGNMSLVDKALFLKEFWRRLDNGQSSNSISLRQRFRQRVVEADERFGNSRTAGHRTERGRIYALCGEPDDKEIHNLDINTKPYEVWSYHQIQGGVIFVFIDRSGFGEYSLIHSTLRGEIYNPDWYDSYVERGNINSKR